MIWIAAVLGAGALAVAVVARSDLEPPPVPASVVDGGLVLAAVVAIAVAVQQAVVRVGADDGCDCVLYRPGTWRNNGFARDLMTSRLYAVLALLLFAGLAAVLSVQRRRSRQ